MVFDGYAQYYDEFYSTKNYAEECAFLIKIGGLKPGSSLLDLGCGTGGHALLMAQHGFHVTGVDLSEKMIEQARQKAANAGLAISLIQGDIRNARIPKKFDTVVSMFAVMSYQVSNEDLIASFKTAREHIQDGGLFIFDAWYGPAVLHQQPSERIKVYQLNEDRIIRIARPDLNIHSNTVAVHYDIIHLQQSNILNEVQEEHPMRFFFEPEIELVSKLCGFSVVDVCPFLTPGVRPTQNDWNVTWILKAN